MLYYWLVCSHTVTPRLLQANQMVAAASFPTYALQSPILKTGNCVYTLYCWCILYVCVCPRACVCAMRACVFVTSTVNDKI